MSQNLLPADSIAIGIHSSRHGEHSVSIHLHVGGLVAGWVMFDSSSEGIAMTERLVNFASSTALRFGYTNSSPEFAPG